MSVDVRKLQVAILARSSRDMSLTGRILPRYILSRVRVSVHWVADRSLSCQTDPSWLAVPTQRRWLGVCVFASVSRCEHACMHACVRDVFAIYDRNILLRLKMIIIKIVILYFIQIRHTDYFPSTGTRLVIINVRLWRNRYWLAIVIFILPVNIH